MAGAFAQTVGIGTVAPDTSAVLDIFSTNKGVLVPRVLDTARVTKPVEGVIVYNRNTRSPYYFDGNKWLSLGGRLPSGMSSSTDKITYLVTGTTNFSITEKEIYSASHGISVPVASGGTGHQVGNPAFSSFSFTKEIDINTEGINLAVINGTQLPAIEFKYYASGATVPYLSYRFKNVVIEAYQVSGSAGGGPLVENITIAFINYGFKDWVNNKEFGFNRATNVASAY